MNEANLRLAILAFLEHYELKKKGDNVELISHETYWEGNKVVVKKNGYPTILLKENCVYRSYHIA